MSHKTDHNILYWLQIQTVLCAFSLLELVGMGGGRDLYERMVWCEILSRVCRIAEVR